MFFDEFLSFLVGELLRNYFEHLFLVFQGSVDIKCAKMWSER